MSQIRKNITTFKKATGKKLAPHFTESEELSKYSGKVLAPKKHKEAEAFFQNIRTAS